MPSDGRETVERDLRLAERDAWIVASALRAAANYFEVHYKSIRFFRGGQTR